MDQIKTGKFIAKERKDKKYTQRELADKLGISDKTISKWERGTNMPDLSLLVELADYYEVDIREIIDGGRKNEKMNSEEKEKLEKVVEYVDNEKQNKARKLNKYFKAGLACFVVAILNGQFRVLSYIFQNNVDEFVSGALCSLGLLFEFIGFYNNNHDVSLRQRKLTWINSLKR